MTGRRMLPNRRRHIAFDTVHDEISAHVTVTFIDGKPLEVFIDCGKPGSAINVAGHDFGVVCSLALQHSTPLASIRKALLQLPDGSGAGLLAHVIDQIDAAGYAVG